MSLISAGSISLDSTFNPSKKLASEKRETKRELWMLLLQLTESELEPKKTTEKSVGLFQFTPYAFLAIQKGKFF